MEMANELQITQEKMRRIDKTTIIKLAIDYIRAHDVLCCQEQMSQVALGVQQAGSMDRPRQQLNTTRLQTMNLNTNCEKSTTKNNRDINEKVQRQQTRRNNKINSNQENFQRELSSSDDDDDDFQLNSGRHVTLRGASNDENVDNQSYRRHHQHQKSNVNNSNSLLCQIHKSRRIETEELPLPECENQQVSREDCKRRQEEDFYVAKQQEKPVELPNISTASIFEPKTIDNMNEHYLMINDNESEKSASFVLKLDEDILDEDDLTHLAPQAGDVHILLDVEPLDNIVLDLDKTASLFVSPLSPTTIIDNCQQVANKSDDNVGIQMTTANRRDFIYHNPSVDSNHQQQQRGSSGGRQQQTIITSFRGGTGGGCDDINYCNSCTVSPQKQPVYHMDTKLLASDFYQSQQQYRHYLQQTHDI